MILVLSACAGPADSVAGIRTRAASYTPSPTRTFEQFKQDASRISYDELYRNSERYSVKGAQELVYFVAEVVGAEKVLLGEFGSFYSMESLVTLTGQGDWEGRAVITYDSPLRIGDLVEVAGYYQGLESYSSTTGGVVTLPKIHGTSVNLLLKTTRPY